MSQETIREHAEFRQAAMVMNFKIVGFALGIVFGLIIFLATNFLVLKGGEIGADGEAIVGPHMQLLGQFFIGYSVTFWGSIVGLLYGFCLGTLSGALLGFFYNKIMNLRSRVGL